jgi:hypothetical protein
MVHRFRKPYLPVKEPPSDSTCLGTQPDLIDLIDVYEGPGEETIRDLSYLQLNGDLRWLKPLPEATMKEHEWSRGNVPPAEDLAAILDATKRMDVELPTAFIKFLSSQEYTDALFLGGKYVELLPKLIECRGADDKNGGGFIIRFLCDQQGCGYWALYAAPGGYHCVVMLPEDPWEYFEETLPTESDDSAEHIEMKEDHNLLADRADIMAARALFLEESRNKRAQSSERYEDVIIATKEFGLSHIHNDFEEWLVTKYFDMWIGQTVEDAESELLPSQMEYLKNCWIEDRSAFIRSRNTTCQMFD